MLFVLSVEKLTVRIDMNNIMRKILKNPGDFSFPLSAGTEYSLYETFILGFQVPIEMIADIIYGEVERE